MLCVFLVHNKRSVTKEYFIYFHLFRGSYYDHLVKFAKNRNTKLHRNWRKFISQHDTYSKCVSNTKSTSDFWNKIKKKEMLILSCKLVLTCICNEQTYLKCSHFVRKYRCHFDNSRRKRWIPFSCASWSPHRNRDIKIISSLDFSFWSTPFFFFFFS